MYTVERDPEHPGDGVWRCPVVHAGPESQGLGPPLVLRISPEVGGDWVVWIDSDGTGRLRTVQPTPSDDRLLAVVDGLAYLVPTSAPGPPEVVTDQVQQVAPTDTLVLLVRWSDMVAIGVDGTAWRSDRLCVDDLEVVEVDGWITCSGWFEDGHDTVVVDSATGLQVGGRRVHEAFTPAGVARRRRWWRRRS